jgi:TPR repeat protein
MRAFSAVAAVATIASCAACGQLGTPPSHSLPADVHAPPSAEELADNPCRYGDRPRCAAKCEHGDAQACNGAGVLYEFSGDPIPALAARYYGMACDASYGPGCNNLAWLYLGGRGVPHDPPHAMVLFMAAFDAARLACARGDGSGCLLAGELLFDGVGVDADEPGALALFRQGCDRGVAQACERAARE